MKPRWRAIIGSFFFLGCGGGARGGDDVILKPPAATATATATGHSGATARDAACPTLLSTLDEVERACPSTDITRATLQTGSARGRFSTCADRVVAIVPRVEDESVRGAAEFVAHVTRRVASPELDALAGELASGPPLDVEPVYALVSRQRAHSHASLRSWCGVDSTGAAPAAWLAEVEGMLLARQAAQSQCLKDANDRLAMNVEKGAELHYRLHIDAGGRVLVAAPTEVPGGMRSDAALCIIRDLEAMRFPAPGLRTVVGSNVTFAR